MVVITWSSWSLDRPRSEKRTDAGCSACPCSPRASQAASPPANGPVVERRLRRLPMQGHVWTGSVAVAIMPFPQWRARQPGDALQPRRRRPARRPATVDPPPSTGARTATTSVSQSCGARTRPMSAANLRRNPALALPRADRGRAWVSASPSSSAPGRTLRRRPRRDAPVTRPAGRAPPPLKSRTPSGSPGSPSAERVQRTRDDCTTPGRGCGSSGPTTTSSVPASVFVEPRSRSRTARLQAAQTRLIQLPGWDAAEPARRSSCRQTSRGRRSGWRSCPPSWRTSGRSELHPGARRSVPGQQASSLPSAADGTGQRRARIDRGLGHAGHGRARRPIGSVPCVTW